MKRKNHSWLCAQCKSKIDENAYYCRNCDAIVRNDVVAGSRIPDKTLSTRLTNIWKRHPFQKLIYLVLAIAIGISGTHEVRRYLISNSDNKSSTIFQLQVDSPRAPLTCRLHICHMLIHIRNKTNAPQRLVGIPYFQLSTGASYGPADPKAVAYPIYFGQYYCQAKLDIKFGPAETVPFLGICTMNIPAGSTLTKVIILDQPQGQEIVSSRLKVLVPGS